MLNKNREFYNLFIFDILFLNIKKRMDITMKLLYNNEVLGEIEIIEKETFWISGNFKIYPNALKYKKFFSALVKEDEFNEKLYDKDLLDENNWYIIENNKTRGISLPAIYEDGDIFFKYREES